jgi:predicted nuclease with RNAse H fold
VSVRTLGIDVAVRRGLDVVILNGDRAIVDTRRRVTTDEIAALVGEVEPAVVAIDAPPAWASSGRSRLTERELRLFGLQCFNTPSDKRMADHPFYEWMSVGFTVYERIAEGYPRFRGTGSVHGTAIEVFPHASAVVLAGCLPPAGVSKQRFRREVLADSGVDAHALRSIDQVDAALAALTGLLALARRFSAPGDPREGQIVLPSASLPARPYRRGRPPATPVAQPALPGLAPCACGDPDCQALTAREFAPGHDAKRKAVLWKRAREGTDALDELAARGWEPPPEMR